MAHVYDEYAYDSAIRRNIMANAAKGRRQRWLAADSSRIELLKMMDNDAFNSEFIRKMQDAYMQWGSLTDKQEAAIRAHFERKEAKKQERIAADSSSQHVGTIGERRIFNLNIQHTASYETEFGICHVSVMKDSDGNILVYKGFKTLGAKGDDITLRATIKAHGEREGVKQTILNRPMQGNV
jgi:hypothetical protein